MLSIYWFYMLLFTSCNIYDILGIPQNKKVYITLEINEVMPDKAKRGGYNVSMRLY